VKAYRVLTVAALMVLVVTGCRSKSVTVASLTGPTSGDTGDTLDFNVAGEDPDGRDLSYGMDWGDTSSLAWTAPYPSGTQVTLQHVYRDTGFFHVRAKARAGAADESEWFGPVRVHIREEWPEKPAVALEAINTGAALRLCWTAVVNAKSYEVKTDDSTYTTTSLSFDVTTPTAIIEVRAVNGNNKSDPATIECRVVQTASLMLYGISDPDPNHPSGLAFAVDGSAIALSLADDNKAWLDFVCDDQNVSPVGFVNAGDYGWPQNSEINTLMDAGTTDYDAFVEAAASGYVPQLVISANAVYAIWLSNSVTWTTSDHFCKAKIIAIEDVGGAKKVTCNVGYQLIGGLRWLMTD